ncbi:MAG: RelA/SpoT domain-containing protein [Tenacibaculum sp.]|uniref:RelA/SpoT domain-containing protein n=1 Tax=Tenacibaculum sp. TaxID=1906242 RepID=UPI00185CCBA9|nr:RelA/SpoT domain-containing protein [Tenacibaculum sp.]NVK08148.1 RelA/SpoT domain-containing protein [Tenacibaculum sp.]
MSEFKSILDFYKKPTTQFQLDSFRKRVKDFFENNPAFHNHSSIVHSVKSRLKDVNHLEKKLVRKTKEKKIELTTENLFAEITDLIGVRVLHLYFDQFSIIHKEIMKQIENGEWTLFEPPKAYTWDPDMSDEFEKFGIKTNRKDSYTSVHYVIKPNSKENAFCCEIQVRTLFEEIWGEIDHSINYPVKTSSIACAEQLKVLSKLTSTGTRLADSIFRSHEDHNKD